MLASVTPLQHRGIRCRSQLARRPVPVVRAQAASTVRELLDDISAAKLGKVRFIVLGDGAILESVSDWGSVRYNDVPSRGVLATIASEDKSFECHITTGKVKEVRFAQSKAKQGDWDIFATRFLADDGRVMLSCLLHGNKGSYQPGAVEAWSGLAKKYGDSVKF